MAKAIPIFRIFDYKRALEHYIDWMEFKVDWKGHLEENSPVYMQISKGDLVLHLSEHSGDCSPGARIYIENYEGLKAYHKLLIDKKYKYNRPGIGESYWVKGVTEMETIDPFGNKMTFTENVPYII
jgi:Glyoxalase superfamily protein